MSWTDERVEKLTTLWAEGLSASQIAAVLGDVTRNAVIGKVHRLGLAGRAKSSSSGAGRTQKPAATTRRSTKMAKPNQPNTSSPAVSFPTSGAAALQSRPAAEKAPLSAVAVHPQVDPDQAKTTILDLNEGTCRWPIGDPGQEGFHYCGQNPRASGGPYCDFHARIAYQPVQQRASRRIQAVSA